MKTLRLLLDESFGGEHCACAWALIENDQLLERGRGGRQTWPQCDRALGVIGAARARVMRLALPDLPAAKFRAALAYAVEARIAGEPEAQRLAAGPLESDGKRRVVVSERAWVDQALRSLANEGLTLAKLVAEGELPEKPPEAWWWQRAGAGGYLLTGDDLLPLDDAGAEIAPPSLLLLALERGGARRPERLIICGDEPSSEQQLSWAQSLGLAIEWRPGGDPLLAPDNRFEAAQTLLVPLAKGGEERPEDRNRRRWRFAAAIAVLAAGLHLAAGLADTLRLALSVRALEGEASRLLAERFPEAEPVLGVYKAFREHYARARHAAGLPAPLDAIALLARAAPALAQTGESSLRQAHFSGGRWTLDLAPMGAEQRQRLLSDLRLAGFAVIYAEQANGLRLMLQENQP